MPASFTSMDLGIRSPPIWESRFRQMTARSSAKRFLKIVMAALLAATHGKSGCEPAPPEARNHGSPAQGRR